ncbi:MAG: hypothetical protein K0R50_2329 [Eubacterium sp.]|jgi:N-acetylglucosamine kinase-like BadF-type ATPase|nr:hypothetical protein [Eubacterium sp.]
MAQYVLGVDGGGTKTQCALYDIEGKQVDFINWGPTNHEVLKGGFLAVKSEMTVMVNYLLKRNGIQLNQIVKSVFGMAGVDTKSQHAEVSKIIKDLGFENFELYNDAYLGIKAGSKNGWGIGVVHGTGVCVAGIDHLGNTLQIGGQGMLTGDFGGGTYLGGKFIQSIYNYYFRCGEYTYMLELLPDELKVSSKHDFIDNATKKIDEGLIKVAELNRLVFEAANREDAAAINILKELGESLAQSINGCIRGMDFEESVSLQIVLSGSINTKANNTTIIDTIKERVASGNRDRTIEFIILDKIPAMGAVIWALESILDRSEINRIFL